jgi:serine/threonine protein kinase
LKLRFESMASVSQQRTPGGGADVAEAVSGADSGSLRIAETKPSSLPRVCPNCGGRYPADFKVCPHDATPLSEAQDDGQDPMIGATLAESYQIVRLVGEGGMGRVYEARHTRLRNKRYAIKMLLDEYARQPEVVTRFQREAESASGIHHPNVVDVYDVHRTEDGRPFIVGEFLEGEEFGALLDRIGRMPVGEAVRIVRQVCRALEAAHAQGIVHRDMKPENVFLVGEPTDPVVKVLDFGISKQQNADNALTQTGMVMGTPSYMAPEQARGAKVDHRADIYSVGGILYRALTGQKPFDADEPAAILTAVLTEEPPRPRSVDPSIPEALELVIQRAMSKEPRDRFATMAEFESELAPFDARGPLTTPAAVVPARSAMPSVVTDKTLPAQAGLAESVLAATREARSARPMLVTLSLLAYVWLVGGTIGIVADVVRLVRGTGSTLSATEAILVATGTVVATATPGVLWVRHVARRIWSNSVRAVALARRLRRALFASVAAYGFGALAVHLTEGVVERASLGTSGALSNLVLFGIALGVAAVAWLPGSLYKR